MVPRVSSRPRPRERAHHERRTTNTRSPQKSKAHAASSSGSSSQALSADALAKLDRLNQHARQLEVTPKKARWKREPEIIEEKYVVERSRRQHKRKKRRVVSGALLEEADSDRLRGIRGGYDKYEKDNEEDAFLKRRKRLCSSFSNSSSA
jgi:glucan 1,3-beta-glucosidase